LGVLYGRGVPSIAEQLGTTTKKAQTIKDSVMKGFPAIEQFEKDSLEMAEDFGYVTTLWGRKRRLPSMQLPDFEFTWKDGAKPSDDPLNFDDEEELEVDVPDYLIEKYIKKLNNSWGSKRQEIYQEANAEGIWIVDNTKIKADAQRQCVNARIQGSAADMSKLAMIKIGTDERLKELGFRMLIPVHDEIIAECPEENAKECAERFSQLMSEAPGDKFTIPISCDVEITKQWYGERVQV
jgi:DNA polymerase I-like protein with 3'-5' exonuclease and polymerase domains